MRIRAPAILLAASFGVLYHVLLRPAILTWGATDAQTALRLPMRVKLVEPGEVLSWRSADGNWVWTFVIGESGGTTRLISRNRYRLTTLAARIGMLAMEPASLVMERKMLRGIKQRAERHAHAAQALVVEDDDAVAPDAAPGAATGR